MFSNGLMSILLLPFVPLAALFLVKRLFKMLGIGKMGVGMVTSAAIKATRDGGISQAANALGIPGALNGIGPGIKNRLKRTPMAEAWRKKSAAAKHTRHQNRVDKASDRLNKVLQHTPGQMGADARAALRAGLIAKDPRYGAYLDELSSGSKNRSPQVRISSDSRSKAAALEAARTKNASSLDALPSDRLLEAEALLAGERVSQARTALTGLDEGRVLTDVERLAQVGQAQELLGEIPLAVSSLGLGAMPIVTPDAHYAAGITAEGTAHPIWYLSESEKSHLISVRSNHGDDAYVAAATNLLAAKGLYDVNSGEFQDMLQLGDIDLGSVMGKLRVDHAIEAGTLIDGVGAAVGEILNRRLQHAAIEGGKQFALNVAQVEADIAAASQAQLNAMVASATDRLQNLQTAVPEELSDFGTLTNAIESRMRDLDSQLRSSNQAKADAAREECARLQQRLVDQAQEAISAFTAHHNAVGVLISAMSIEVGSFEENLANELAIQEAVASQTTAMLERLQESFSKLEGAVTANDLGLAGRELQRKLDRELRGMREEAHEHLQAQDRYLKHHLANQIDAAANDAARLAIAQAPKSIKAALGKGS